MQAGFRRLGARAFALPLLAGLALACKSSVDGGPADAGASAAPPPALVLKGDRADLVFTYRAPDDGAFRTATKIAEIPEAARASVVVADLSVSPEKRQAGRYVYVADLSAPREDGSYRVALASRYAIEHGEGPEGLAPPKADGVVVYSTSWCGVCKTAKKTLERWGVPFVEKDIEASRAAQQELAAKAAAQGVKPNGVPVIDVGGQLLQGFDERTLKGILQKQGRL